MFKILTRVHTLNRGLMSRVKPPPGNRPLKTLERVLSKAGLGSRTEARKWIGTGRVRVNGKLIQTPDHWVDLERDAVVGLKLVIALGFTILRYAIEPEIVVLAKLNVVLPPPTVRFEPAERAGHLVFAVPGVVGNLAGARLVAVQVQDSGAGRGHA